MKTQKSRITQRLLDASNALLENTCNYQWLLDHHLTSSGVVTEFRNAFYVFEQSLLMDLITVDDQLEEKREELENS